MDTERAAVLAAALLLATSGCGDDESPAAGGGTPTGLGGQGGTGGAAGCQPPARLVSGACLEPGVADDGCPAGTVGQQDGSCEPAGIPPAGCDAGFTHDGDGGCVAVLPATPCSEPGTMAVPGDDACRLVMDCGSGRWGDIPVDGNTVYVDVSYGGGGNDGTEAAPYTSVNEAVFWAPSGALVAIAEGTYVEDFLVDKPVTLHGVCPTRVTFSGPDPNFATLSIVANGSGATVRGVQVTDASGSAGIMVFGATDVTLDGLWVQGNDQAIGALRTDGSSAELAVTGTLIEDSVTGGINAWGSTITVEGCVVRRTVVPSGGDLAAGVLAKEWDETSSELTVRGSVIEQSEFAGINALGAAATIEASVIRDTLPSPSGWSGAGVVAQFAPASPIRPDVAIRGSVIERSQAIGIFGASAHVEIDRTVVRDSLPDATSPDGRGISVQPSAYATVDPASTLTVQSSLIEAAAGLGIYVAGSELTLISTILQDMELDALGAGGRALNVRASETTGQGSTIDVRGSVLQRNREVSFILVGSTATVTGTLVTETTPSDQSSRGRAMSIQSNIDLGLSSNASISASVFAQSSNHGIFLGGSSLQLDSSLIRDIAADEEGKVGRGLGVQYEPVAGLPSEAWVEDCLFERTTGAGVFASGSSLTMDRSTIRDVQPNAATGGGVGLSIQQEEGGPASTAVLRQVSVADSHLFGAMVVGSSATMEDCTLRGSRSVGELYGDGLTLLGAGSPASVSVTRSRITDNDRAGILYFGGTLLLGDSELSCNGIDLVDGSTEGTVGFDNQGGNRCGCPPSTEGCIWTSNNVSAPTPLEPDQGMPESGG